MLTPKENFLETIKKDGKPDRLVSLYDPLTVIPDPVGKFCRENRVKGTTSVDKWGVTIVWPEDQVAAMPHVTEENKVLPDIENWKDYVKVPDLVANCDDPALWEPTLEAAAKVDRNEQLIMSVMPTGIFEQMHALMGFEDTLCNLLMEPEYMMELADAIGEFRMDYARLLVKYLKPDVVISMDDWGSKESLFMKPEVWREIIKPQYEKLYKYLKDNGVIVIHHSDTFIEPLIEDMVELGVDVWQGAIPANDIKGLQKQLDGRMAMMGGFDCIIDREDTPEEEIRAEMQHVCRDYGLGGHFIPCITYGPGETIYPHVYPIMRDEIARFNEENFGISGKPA